jgi:putative CocE/NonD family hydrolase
MTTTRREFLELIGWSLPSWAIPSWAVAAAGREPQPSSAVALDDPAVKVIENVWIPMADGARLAARIFLPAAAQTSPAGAVLEYLPYRKRDAYRYRDDVAGPFLAKGGIALVRVDIRGTGDSDGSMVDEYMPIEQADALAVIDWIAHQPWCNGNVGMRGISYGAFTALQAAAKAPVALKAIVSTCGTELRYPDDIHYRGGCLIADQLVWGMQWQVIMRAPPDPAIVGADRWRALWQQRLDAAVALSILWNEHQTLDAKWQDGSIQDYSTIRCAIYNVGGMLDSYLPSVPRMMERAPQVPQKGLVGPWAHKWPGYPQPAGHHGEPTHAANGVPGPAVDWLPVETRWWRHWLLGEANGIMEEPRLWAFREGQPAATTFPRDTIGSWVSERDWPSPEIQMRTWHLNADGLAAQPGPETLLVHRTNLTIGFCNPSLSPSADPTSWWRDQSRDDALSLVFDSRPLEESMDVMGEPLFTVRVRSDRPVAKLCARLSEVTPQGHSNFICYGLVNLTHRDSDATPTALVPGHDYDVRIKGHFSCYRFSRGSRIRVALSETWWPVVWPSPEMVTLHVTAGASTLELPVRPTKAGETPPFNLFRDRYAVPGEQPAPYTHPLQDVKVSGHAGSRTFSLIGGGGSLAPGSERISGINTIISEAYSLRRSIREDDPNTAEMETEAINVFEREDWGKLKVRAGCLCRSTPTHFVCTESFEAWEGDRAVISRTWEKRIPRELV